MKSYEEYFGTNGHRSDRDLMFDLGNIIILAKEDPGMKDLLDKVIEYYALKGYPKLMGISGTAKTTSELNQELTHRIMNTRYGL